MPPMMQAMQKVRTQLTRKNKNFECVHVGPIRLYFSAWVLIGFESDKTPITVNKPPAPYQDAEHAPGEIIKHRLELEPDRSKWLSTTEFSERWTKLSEIYFK